MMNDHTAPLNGDLRYRRELYETLGYYNDRYDDARAHNQLAVAAAFAKKAAELEHKLALEI